MVGTQVKEGTVADISVAEAARQLGVTPQTVRQAIYAGYIEAEKRNRSADGTSLLTAFYVTPEAVAHYRAHHLGRTVPKGEGPRLADPEERAAMAEAGYLPIAEASRRIGIEDTYLTRLVRQGRVEAEKKSIWYIPRATVERMKRERDEKLAKAGVR